MIIVFKKRTIENSTQTSNKISHGWHRRHEIWATSETNCTFMHFKALQFLVSASRIKDGRNKKQAVQIFPNIKMSTWSLIAFPTRLWQFVARSMLNTRHDGYNDKPPDVTNFSKDHSRTTGHCWTLSLWYRALSHSGGKLGIIEPSWRDLRWSATHSKNLSWYSCCLPVATFFLAGWRGGAAEMFWHNSRLIRSNCFCPNKILSVKDSIKLTIRVIHPALQ